MLTENEGTDEYDTPTTWTPKPAQFGWPASDAASPAALALVGMVGALSAAPRVKWLRFLCTKDTACPGHPLFHFPGRGELRQCGKRDHEQSEYWGRFQEPYSCSTCGGYPGGIRRRGCDCRAPVHLGKAGYLQRVHHHHAGPGRQSPSAVARI